MSGTLPQDLPVILPLPSELEHDWLGTIIRATATAGIWAERRIRKALREGQMPQGKGSGADITSWVDLTSERLMAAIQQQEGYRGGVIGEELTSNGMNILPAAKETASEDGIDGTENAWRFLGDYGPCIGRFREEGNGLIPLIGGTYLPRSNIGFVGSAVTGDVFRYSLIRMNRKDSWTIADFQELPPFSQEATAVRYHVGAWTEAPSWLPALVGNADAGAYQNCLRAAASPEGLGKLLENPLDNQVSEEQMARQDGIGFSAYIGCGDLRLHDIAWALPALQALGGIAGKATGELITDPGFFPERGTIKGRAYGGGLAGLKESGLLSELPIGPFIAAHNRNIFETTRRLMGYETGPR